MNNLKHINIEKKHQQGAALIVVLVLMTIVTIIGISNMQGATMEMKMVSSTLTRNRAFAIADAAIREVEKDLELNFFGLHENDLISALQTDVCTDANTCFDPTCGGGLCFQGSYTSDTTERYNCRSYSADGPNPSTREKFWEDESHWSDDSGLHRTVTVNNVPSTGDTPFESVEVKYIVEFLCFVRNEASVAFDPTNPNNGKPWFRYTLYLEDEDNRAPIMLQTTYAR